MSSAGRLLNVLHLFTIERPDWTVELAAAELGLTISTAYRYFKSLVEAGLLTSDTPGRYSLGPAIIQFDRQMRERDPLIASATPIMRRLARDAGTGVSVVLCRLYQTQVLCVHQESIDPPEIDPRFQMRRQQSYERGQPMPLYRGAPSKAILAHMSAKLVKPIYDADPQAMEAAGLGEDWTEVKRSLRKLRQGGVVETQGELAGAMKGYALPIHAAQDNVIGSISLVMPGTKAVPSREAVTTMLTEAVGEIRETMLADLEERGLFRGRPLPGFAASASVPAPVD